MPRTKSKRGKHEGTIGRRKDGSWYGRIQIRGKQKWFRGKTRREVADAMDEWRMLHRVSSSKPNTRTLADFLNSWLASEVRPNKTTGTYARYEGHARLRIIPFLGKRRLNELNDDHVTDFYLWLRENASTNNAYKSAVVLTTALRFAVARKLIPVNSADGITKPQHKPNHEQIKFWTEEQVRQFLDVAEGDRFYALFVTALGTGMRQGELFALQWSDVDLDGRTISVQKSLSEVNGVLEINEAKSKSNRVISISPKVVAALKAHRREMLVEGHDVDTVFCSKVGGYLRKGNFNRRHWHPVVEQAGLDSIVFHGMRHTHATLLLAGGTNVKVVSERLGHADVGITLNRYSHVLPKQDRTAADSLDRVL